jgi:hypothetical protein
MTKEELDNEIEEVRNSLDNMNAEDMKKFILESKNNTINEFKDITHIGFEVMDFLKDKDVKYLEAVITISVKRIEELLTKEDD